MVAFLVVVWTVLVAYMVWKLSALVLNMKASTVSVSVNVTLHDLRDKAKCYVRKSVDRWTSPVRSHDVEVFAMNDSCFVDRKP